MNRDQAVKEPETFEGHWDMIVIGRGATGLGVGVVAASRGYKTLLLEQHDFAKGTSNRSTKLVHGGVRSLCQGNISLVLDARAAKDMTSEVALIMARDIGYDDAWKTARSMCSPNWKKLSGDISLSRRIPSLKGLQHDLGKTRQDKSGFMDPGGIIFQTALKVRWHLSGGACQFRSQRSQADADVAPG